MTSVKDDHNSILSIPEHTGILDMLMSFPTFKGFIDHVRQACEGCPLTFGRRKSKFGTCMRLSAKRTVKKTAADKQMLSIDSIAEKIDILKTTLTLRGSERDLRFGVTLKGFE